MSSSNRVRSHRYITAQALLEERRNQFAPATCYADAEGGVHRHLDEIELPALRSVLIASVKEMTRHRELGASDHLFDAEQIEKLGNKLQAMKVKEEKMKAEIERLTAVKTSFRKSVSACSHRIFF